MRLGTRPLLSAALATAFVGIPLAAMAADAAQSRIAGYRELGAAFKNVNDTLKSGSPQPVLLQQAARTINATAKAQYGWFPAGSGPRPGVKTRAKPEIWSNAAQFKAAQDNFAKAAGAFSQAVASGNMDAVTAQSRALGATCGGCHRTFRAEER